MSTWLNKTMCNTPDFILRSAWWHIIGLLYKVQNWKKRFRTMKISYQEGTVVAFQISESRLFELFLFQSVEKAFFIDCFSVTCKLLMLKTKLYSSSQQTFEGTDNKSKSLPTLYSKNFPNLQKRMGVGQMLVGNRFCFVLWKALTPRRVPYCPTCRW